jgi:hypothetical protein
VVHHAAQAERLSRGGRRIRSRLAASAAALLGALVLASCGGDPPADRGVGGGQPLRLADCDAWNESSVEERLVTVRQLRDFAGGPIGEVPEGARGAILDDDEAYDLLERYCEAEFAGAFRLYKLYVRAAAFLGH